MKPFYDKDVHFTASREELINLRVAVGNYACKYRELVETPEDREHLDKLVQLHADITNILEALPF